MDSDQPPPVLPSRMEFRQMADKYGPWAVMSAIAALMRRQGQTFPTYYAKSRNEWYSKSYYAPNNGVGAYLVRATATRARTRNPTE